VFFSSVLISKFLSSAHAVSGRVVREAFKAVVALVGAVEVHVLALEGCGAGKDGAQLQLTSLGVFLNFDDGFCVVAEDLCHVVHAGECADLGLDHVALLDRDFARCVV